MPTKKHARNAGTLYLSINEMRCLEEVSVSSNHQTHHYEHHADPVVDVQPATDDDDSEEGGEQHERATQHLVRRGVLRDTMWVILIV